jgi:hypothetical protein
MRLGVPVVLYDCATSGVGDLRRMFFFWSVNCSLRCCAGFVRCGSAGDVSFVFLLKSAVISAEVVMCVRR